jgi:hypothetical protein
MQERTEPESKINYWYKQYLKAPAQLVGFGALLALCFIYHESKQGEKEFREYMARQMEWSNSQNEKLYAQNEKLLTRIEEETKTLSEIGTQMALLNNRVGHLEREHELNRKENNEKNRH